MSDFTLFTFTLGKLSQWSAYTECQEGTGDALQFGQNLFYMSELQNNPGFSGLKYNYYVKYNVTCGTLSLWLVTLTPYSLKGVRQKEPYLPFLN